MRSSSSPKNQTLPPIRIAAKTKRTIEAHLHDDETLSSFVEEAVLQSLERRRQQEVFIARGLASAREAKRTGEYVSSDAVLQRLSESVRSKR